MFTNDNREAQENLAPIGINLGRVDVKIVEGTSYHYGEWASESKFEGSQVYYPLPYWGIIGDI